MNVAEVKALAEKVRAEVGKAIVGQADTVDLMLTALFARGHVLLEGPPGVAKIYLAQCFARTLDLTFGRIQFTPDLMPADIIGANVFNFQTSAFSLAEGPIFCELLLADEINRTPPKTQAALLEAMQERRVTIDGRARPLSDRFMVVATQNPLEQQGVYPLPEAQLDRFLFKHVLAYPSEGEERGIVAATGASVRMPDPGKQGVEPVISREDSVRIAEAVRKRMEAAKLRDSVAKAKLAEETQRKMTDSIIAANSGAAATPTGPRRLIIAEPVEQRLWPEAPILGHAVGDSLRRMLRARRGQYVVVDQDSVRMAMSRTRDVTELTKSLNADLLVLIRFGAIPRDSAVLMLQVYDLTAVNAYRTRTAANKTVAKNEVLTNLDVLLLSTLTYLDEMSRAPRRP